MLASLLRFLPERLPGFLMVGSVGFVVDAAILATLVHGFDWGTLIARLVSFAAAVTTTWLLNREFVFRDARLANKRQEYSRYISLQGIGAGVNLGIYTLCISASDVMNAFPLTALAAGSAAALIFNYLGMRFFVFTGARQTKQPH